MCLSGHFSLTQLHAVARNEVCESSKTEPEQFTNLLHQSGIAALGGNAL